MDVTPPAPDFATNLVMTRRPNIALLIALIGIGFLGVAIYAATKGFRSDQPQATTERKTEDRLLEEANAIQAAEHRSAYLVGGVVCLFGGFFGLGIGGWTFTKQPALGREAPDARTVILAAGMGFGLTLFLLGTVLGILWFNNVAKWLDDGDRSAAAYVLIPAGLMLLGAALAFLSTGPARADVRTDPTIRRLVYGANAILSTLLMLALLIGINIAVSLRAPGKLDTTEAGFYSLSDETKQYLESNNQTILLYALIPDEERLKEPGRRIVADTRRLLNACEDNGRGKFKVQYVSEIFDKDLLVTLREKFKLAGGTENGLLITVPSDEARFTFLRLGDLVTTTAPESGPPRPVFQGEAKLMSELVFLGENKQRAVVYVTQSSGELTILPRQDREPQPDRTANRLRELLLKLNMDVKPLVVDRADPNIPKDAAMVIVADPKSPLPLETVRAITQYMEAPRDGKAGKLIVLAGANPKPVGKGISETGLEPLLQTYGIKLGTSFLFGAMMAEKDKLGIGRSVLAAPSALLARARNPIAVAAQQRGAFLGNARTVDVPPANNTATGPKGEILLYSTEDQETWLEADLPTNPVETFNTMVKDPKLMAQKEFSDKPRPMAAIVKDGDTPRAVVVGSGIFFSDKAVGEAGGTAEEMFGRSVNWLRERPTVGGIASKSYGEYSIDPRASYAKLFWVPVLLGLLLVVALGAGVWVVRRK